MAYKDVSNYVAGPKHTRQAVHTRIAKLNSDSGAAGRRWRGYARGARQSAEDWKTHIWKATGGGHDAVLPRAVRLPDKI